MPVSRSANPVVTNADIQAIAAQPYEDAVPVTNMYDLFRRAAELWGERPAITWLAAGDPDGPTVTYSYADLLRRITQAANMYRDLGVGEDDAVALLLPNMPEAHFALWGAEVAGRASPINNLLNPDHLAHLVEASGAKALVALGPDPELGILERALDLRERCPQLNATLLVEGEDSLDSSNSIHDFTALLDQYPGDRLTFERGLGRETIAAYFHTGGTTGAPKLAQHTHGNQVHTSWSGALLYDLSEQDVMINGFPLFHVAGTFVFASTGYIAGAHLVLPTRTGMRNPEVVGNFWRILERHGVTMMAGVPTVLAALMNVPVDDADISALRVALTGGTPLPTDLAAAFEAQFGIPIRNLFGMTECAGIVSITPTHAERKPNGCGFPLPYTDVKAVPLGSDGPDLSQICAPNESGIMVLRGPHVGPGYTDAARNAGMFTDDGWLISGDLGHVDEHGEVFLTGRAKDVIIRGAHNIDPAMIEETVDEHPAVEISAAIGQPDGYAGELPVVYVTLKAGMSVTEAELLEFLAPRIAERPAMPKRAYIIDAMPVTPIGKIYKPTLRLRSIEDTYAAALADLEEAEGVTVRVEGRDQGGNLSALIHVSGGSDCKSVEMAIGQRLRDFSIPWEAVWE